MEHEKMVHIIKSEGTHPQKASGAAESAATSTPT